MVVAPSADCLSAAPSRGSMISTGFKLSFMTGMKSVGATTVPFVASFAARAHPPTSDEGVAHTQHAREPRGKAVS